MMDKSCHSSGDSATSSNSGGGATSADTRDLYLKHLNKLSHKISKPTVKKPSSDTPPDQNQTFRPPPPPQDLQHQPPVYNINKNDFRDVVQKLTGSPAHDRFAAPPPIQQPKPHSTRLQRIRPPPLAHVSNRPPPMLTPTLPHPVGVMNPNNPVGGGAPGPAPNFNSFGRSLAPSSPLPPLPSVHGAAESPVSAYMRFLQNSASNLDPNTKQFSGFSPLAPAPLQHQLQHPLPPQLQPQFELPPSPLPFGCSNSPKSPHPLLSPGPLFSPSGFPLSPRVPVASPRQERS